MVKKLLAFVDKVYVTFPWRVYYQWCRPSVCLSVRPIWSRKSRVEGRRNFVFDGNILHAWRAGSSKVNVLWAS